MKKNILIGLVLLFALSAKGDVSSCTWPNCGSGGGGLDGVSDITTTGTISGRIIIELILLGYTETPTGAVGDPYIVSEPSLLGGLVNVASEGNTYKYIKLPVIDTVTPLGQNFCIKNTVNAQLVVVPGAGDKFRLGATTLAIDQLIQTTGIPTHQNVEMCFFSRLISAAPTWVSRFSDTTLWESIP